MASSKGIRNGLPDLEDPFYPPPAWAVLPQPEPLATSDDNDDDNNNNNDHQEWTMIEIKGGVETTRFPLHRRPSWLVGRAADQVHIALGHESISRCHARIAFDSSGIPWLRDCQSRHGVFVNKKRLPAAAIATVETNSTTAGSRGVRLFPGDLVQFGASTRIYCIEGPAEFQRGSIRLPSKLKPLLVVPTPEATEEEGTTDKQLEEEEDAGVSWGISMDDAGDSADQNNNDGDDDDDVIAKRQQALEDGANIPDKHRKAWEKIVALKYKLKNVVTESERIQKKGKDNLTTGQEHQLQRNQQRSQELQEKIVERERELYDKLYPETSSRGDKRKKRGRHHYAGDDDVDDFFDRTKDQSSNGDGGDGETEESLLATWKALKVKRQSTSAASERALQKVTHLEQRLERLQAAGDDEAFFAQNDLALVQDQSRKMLTDHDAIVKEMAETKRLLKIVNPKLILEEEDSPASVSSSSFSMAPPPGRKIITESSQATAVMPPPSFRPTPDAAAADDTNKGSPPPSSSTATGNDFMMPPPKRIKSVGLAPRPVDAVIADNSMEAPKPNPPASNPHPSTNISTSSPPKERKVKGPASRPPPAAMGTLAALAAVTSSNVGKSSKNGKADEESGNSSAASANKKSKQTTTIDLKEDVWQAPKDQDGSGRTKLNAKFAGRY